uniref:Tyrosine-protein kinase n=1 Tax=Trichobilharzia regenti TaxID=157069 RepID=A0AA85J509_TRIRE|nr:unnamed protein product [Trichobilharzia regenti]
MAHTSPFQVTISPLCMKKDFMSITNNITSTTTTTNTNSIPPTNATTDNNNNNASSNIIINPTNIVVTPAHLLNLLPGAIPPETTLYFYGKITREQAEELLFKHGASEGLFLLRESVNRNYAVSICHMGRVHHYNVERQTDYSYRIQTGHKFIGPVELVQHHSNQLDGFLTLAKLPLNRPQGVSPIVLQGLNSDELEKCLRVKATEMGLKGQSIEEALSGPMRNHLRFLVVKDLHLIQPWYHHTIRRRDAELRLANEGSPEGAFLVRYRKEDGVYVLSLTSHNEPKHYRIEEHLGRWSIEGGQYFETLMELIDHYHFRQDGLLCKLQKPVSAPISYTRSRSGSGMAIKHSTDHIKIPMSPEKSQHCKVQSTFSSNINHIRNGSHSLPALTTFPISGVNPPLKSTTVSTTSTIVSNNNNSVSSIQSGIHKETSNMLTTTTTRMTTPTVSTITTTTTVCSSPPFSTSIPTPTNPTAATTTSGINSSSSSNSTVIRQDLISFNDWPNVTMLLSNQTTTTLQSPLNRQTTTLTTTAPTTTSLSTTPVIPNSNNFTNSLLIDSTRIPQMALLDRDLHAGITRTMSTATTPMAVGNTKDTRATGCLKPIRLNEPVTSLGKAFAEVDNVIAQVVSNAFSTPTVNNNNSANSRVSTTSLINPSITTSTVAMPSTPMTVITAPNTDHLKNNNNFMLSNNANLIHNTTEINNNSSSSGGNCNHHHHHHDINDTLLNNQVNIIDKKGIPSHRESLPIQTLHFPPILDTPWEEPDCSEDHALSTSSSGGSCTGGGGVGAIGGIFGSVSGFSNSSTTPTSTITTTTTTTTPTPPATTTATNVSTFIGNNPFLPFISPTLTRRTSSTSSPSSATVINPNRTQSLTSPDMSTFCSAICCHHSVQGQNCNPPMTMPSPQFQSNRSAWANAISPENAQQIYDELPPSNFLLSSQTVTLKERLGGGNFGHVVKGLYRTPSGQEVPVAVKTLKPNQIVSAGEREILAEARTMAQLKHRHIVRLIGVCKEEQFMLVLELAPLGPINKYLKRRPDVSVHTLTELMHQVALGMAYLESCKFVHRDLAARNVLLVTRHFAKISDFGMSKALNFGSDYYRAATAGKWPLKWYAPECIYYFRFDSKSDVWSYGITLWEVYSYGERPYRDMKGAQILAMLDQGLRLSRPSRCPESIYSVMQQCWNFEGVHRPTFAELVLTISRILKAMPSPQTNVCIPNNNNNNNNNNIHTTNISSVSNRNGIPTTSSTATTSAAASINTTHNTNISSSMMSCNTTIKFDHFHHSPTHQHTLSGINDNKHNNNTGLQPIEFSPSRRIVGGIGTTSTSSGGSGVNSGGSDGISF